MNDLAKEENAARLSEAVAFGPSYLGASPNASENPQRALDRLFDLAERSSLPVDLHIDEHLDVSRALIPLAAEMICIRGLMGRVAFSHACALAVMEPADLHRTIDLIQRAGATIIVLPETNLLLQDRGVGAPRRRGVAPHKELAAAGVPIRLGTDNVRDWFYPFGNGDMLDTALTAAISMHLDEDRALLAALCDGRDALEVGDPADLVLLRADNLQDCLARRPADRILLRRGEVVVAHPYSN